MKNKISLLLILLSFINLYSQSSKKDEGLKLGFKIGPNLSSFLSSEIENQNIRSGIHLGIISEIIFSNNLSIQPELVYSSQGNQLPLTKQKYEYINLPIIIRYYLNSNLSIDSGIQLGFLIDSLSKGNEGKIKLKNQKKVDFSVSGGSTYDFNNNLYIQARYNLGLTNINNSSNADVYKYQNSVFQISFGAYF